MKNYKKLRLSALILLLLLTFSCQEQKSINDNPNENLNAARCCPGDDLLLNFSLIDKNNNSDIIKTIDKSQIKVYSDIELNNDITQIWSPTESENISVTKNIDSNRNIINLNASIELNNTLREKKSQTIYFKLGDTTIDKIEVKVINLGNYYTIDYLSYNGSIIFKKHTEKVNWNKIIYK